MRKPDWLKRLLSRGQFPKPADGSLTLEEFYDFYHDKLTAEWREECEVLFYRIDPARAPFLSFRRLKHLEVALPIAELLPPLEWWLASSMPRPYRAAFCVRLQRTWQTRLGQRTQEVCVASFHVEVQDLRKAATQ